MTFEDEEEDVRPRAAHEAEAYRLKTLNTDSLVKIIQGHRNNIRMHQQSLVQQKDNYLFLKKEILKELDAIKENIDDLMLRFSHL